MKPYPVAVQVQKEPSRADLLTAFTEAHVRRGGLVCVMCRLPEDIKTRVAELRAAGRPGSSIALGLTSLGFKIGETSVNRHFRLGHQ